MIALATECERWLPDGSCDDTSFSEIDEALDREMAPACDKEGAWLKLPGRVKALASQELLRGMIIAAAEISWSSDALARTILSVAGVQGLNDLKAIQLDDFDLNRLAHLFAANEHSADAGEVAS